MKGLPNVLLYFLVYLKKVQNLSVNTINSYKNDLIIFFKFIKEYHNIVIPVLEFNVFILSGIRKDDIYAFLVYLNMKNNMPSTRKRKIMAIKKFFKWLYMCYKIGENRLNPANDINIVQMYRLPKYLDLEQSKRILNVFNKNNCKDPQRNNLIISIFLNCGLRLSEMISIRIDSIDLVNNNIKIIGKGNRERVIFLNHNIKNKINEYIEKSHNKTYLFENKSGDKISAGMIENICKNAYRLAGLDKYKYTVHTLRHTAATLIYQYGNFDIKTIQEFLGHKSIVSTEIYTHICSEKLKNAVDSNPLNIIFQ